MAGIAQDCAGKGGDLIECPATLKGLEGLFENIIGDLVALGGIVLFLMLIYGGFKYITSGDNPKAVESAKHTLTYAIGGMVLIAMGYLILVLINTFTGADILNFIIYQ